MKRIIAVVLSIILILSLFTLPVSALTVIDEVGVQVIAPQPGKNPRYESTLAHDTYIIDDETSEYKEGGITWYCGDSMMLPTENFEVGNVYTVKVELLRASDSCEFRVNPYVTATINSKEAYISYVSPSYAVIEYTFPVIEGYTVTFDAGSGTGTMNPIEDVAGNFTIPECTFTPPAGKQFKGWLMEQTSEEWYPGEKAPVYNDITLKALWKTASGREEIFDVVATSEDMDTIPVLYGKMKIPSFTVTEGDPAYINATTGNFRWQKKVDDVWETQYDGRFTPGEWRALTSVRIDNDDAKKYELGNPTTLTVNGQQWTADNGTGKPNVYDTFSMIFFNSPVYVIEDDPDITPPVCIENVTLRVEGYQAGLPAIDATVNSDDEIYIESVNFAEFIDTDNDGEIDGIEEITGDFSTEKTYGIFVEFSANPGYDISFLEAKNVSLENAVADIMEKYSEDEDKFTGIYVLAPPEVHKHSMLRIITPATTKEAGKVQHFCEFCSLYYVETVAKIKEVKLSKTTYTYDGKVKKPTVTVVDSKGKKLTFGKDYTVTYDSGRKNVGKYSVKVIFRENYSGKVAKTFTIVPKGTKIKSLANGTKKFTVKWNKQTTQTTGYQIQYATKSSFKGAKITTVAKSKTTSTTISELKAKTNYYVRIRTYKTVSGTKYYSTWSAKKSVKTK